LGEGDWGREWGTGDVGGNEGVGSDLDGFPPHRAFETMGFEGRFGMLGG